MFFLAVLGVTMAIPMKRQMINIEQLRFPSGIAAAETLRALHSHGTQGSARGQALGIAGLHRRASTSSGRTGSTLISAALEPLFDRGLLIANCIQWLLGSHYAAWIGPHRRLVLGPDLSSPPAP